MKYYSYSQNILKNKKLINYLVNKSTICSKDTVLDIGAGCGNITQALVSKADNIIAIEADAKFYRVLINRFANAPNVQVINTDFRELCLPAKKFKVFSNIPFNQTSDILKKILDSRNFDEGYFVLQKEAAERYVGSHIENSCLLSQVYGSKFNFEVIHTFRRSDFLPRPNVDTVFLRIVRKKQSSIPSSQEDFYYDFLAYIFLNSRFSIQRSLKKLFTFRQIKYFKVQLKLNTKNKPTSVAQNQYVEMFKVFCKYNESKFYLVKNQHRRLKLQSQKVKKINRTRKDPTWRRL